MLHPFLSMGSNVEGISSLLLKTKYESVADISRISQNYKNLQYVGAITIYSKVKL